MKYALKDYQGNDLIISGEQATKIANVAELIEVEVAGRVHYLNPKNVASIKPLDGQSQADQAYLDEKRAKFRELT